MCGILGFVTDKPSENNGSMFRKLLLLSETRGKLATGIAYVKDGEVALEKAPQRAMDFIASGFVPHEENLSKVNIAIGHTRQPTVGPPSNNNNNHPIFSERWVMIHNGMCVSTEKIKEYSYMGEVDSEFLLAHIQTKGFDGLKELDGSGAIALIDKTEPTAVWLWRHSNPICLGLDTESSTMFFGSTKDLLSHSLTNKFLFFTSFQLREIPEHVLVKIEYNPLRITDMGLYIPAPKKVVHDHWWANRRVQGWDDGGWPMTPPYEGHPVYKPRDSIIGMTYNRDSKKWETVRDEFQDKKDEVMLRSLGFSEVQILIMKPETAKEICDIGYAPDDVRILSNGEFRLSFERCEPVDGNGTESKKAVPTNGRKRFYLKRKSKDFENWVEVSLPSRGFVCTDGLFYKGWSETRKTHFVMMLEDALEDGLVKDKDIPWEEDENSATGTGTNDNNQTTDAEVDLWPTFIGG